MCPRNFQFTVLSTEANPVTRFPAYHSKRRKILVFTNLTARNGTQNRHPGVVPPMVCLADYNAQFQVVFPEVVKSVCRNITQPV